MTVYKAIKPEAEAAAELAVALAKGEDAGAAVDDEIDNGKKQVPSILLDAGRGDEGQHQGHDRQGRVLDGGRDLHRQVRGRLQGGWHPVGDVGRMPAAPPGAAGTSPAKGVSK